MKIGVIGVGYVGLVHGVVLADLGYHVICVDIDIKKIRNLNDGKVPIYEPGLEELMKKNIRLQRLTFTSDIKHTIKNSDVLFVAVGTPAKEDGSADLKYILEVTEDIGKYINDYKVIVNKSTVPVGTGKIVKNVIRQEMLKRNLNIPFDVVSNPEFLREGKALEDCEKPDRVVIGSESTKSLEIMKKIYFKHINNNVPFVYTNVETAEMIKYASNAFLAVKISFINEMALLAENVGADVDVIASGMGLDSRINSKFLRAGAGYGGSCFPKDTKAIVNVAKKYNEEMYVINAAIKANYKQKIKMVEKICTNMGNLIGKKIGILGLSFKPDTDDVREAPSLEIIRGLIKKGALIRVYCPQGMKEAQKDLIELKDRIVFCNDEYEAVKDTDAIVIITEWLQFNDLNFSKIKSNMTGNYFFDLRNQFVKNDSIRKLFKYFPVGKPVVLNVKQINRMVDSLQISKNLSLTLTPKVNMFDSIKKI